MGTFCVVTFGCRVNQADSLELERDLRTRGLTSAPASEADVVVVNTCSVTASADQGARQIIRRINRDNPAARIIATGCYATRSGADLERLPGVTHVVPNDGKPDLPERVSSSLPETPVRPQTGDGPCGSSIPGPGMAGRTAWTLRVQTGCDEPCAFCVIPRTRGPSRSRSIAHITRELESAVASGFREVVITGVHLGGWGRDLVPARSLIDLLDALAADWSALRFRVSSLEPMDCTPDVRRLLVSHACFAPHFHLPLQHGSDRLLAAMKRPYRVEYYLALVDELKSALPHAAIGSDVLVGFPGETDADHALLIRALERSSLTHLHVFPYSDRPGTEAEALPGKIHGAIIRTRAEEARQLGRLLTERFRAALHGTVRPGLTLEDGTLVVTDNYLKLRIPPGLPRNELVHVRLDRVHEPLSGTVVAVGSSTTPK
jgi:threonylcarbamoyladenosine tRNA methylthiotransferase MtaB